MARSVDALKTDLRFHLSRRFNRSWTPPDWVSINLTLQCNLHCAMCTTCYDVPKELTRDELFDIIDQVALWGVKILNPLGGEPFIRPDIVEILEYACLKDFYITLTTNGTLITDAHARGIARIAYNRLHFNFSIDGFREVHDRIRGEGMFQRTLEGIARIRRADAAAGNPIRKIQINMVVNNLNLDTVPSFLEYCRSLDVQGVQLLNLFKTAGPQVPREIKHLWIPRERWSVLDRVVDEVLEYRRGTDPQQFAVVNSPHELEIMKQYYRGQLPPREAKCYAGWKELYINADGHAIMCDGKLDFLNGEFGNVRQQTLQEIWQSAELRARRDVVKACSSPCIQDCYLRESSDSFLSILQDVGVKVWGEVRKRIPRRPGRWTPFPGSELTVELSDVGDVCPPHDLGTAMERFQQLGVKSKVPFERCYEDPFQYYELRNRGYLNFNRGFLGLEVIKRFVPDLVRAGIRFDTLRLGFRGDPLFHPEFVPVYRYLLEQQVAHGLWSDLRIDTRATLLNTEYVDLALAHRDAAQTFFVKLDAATGALYESVNKKALLEVVEKRLAYLLAKKAQQQADHIRLVLVFTVMPENEGEAVAFRDIWTRRLREQGLQAPEVAVGLLPDRERGVPARDLLFFRRRDDDQFLEQVKSNRALERVAEVLGVAGAVVDRDDGRAPRCAAPFKTPTITWDGKVTVCDQDRTLKLKVGEVTTEDLSEIWWQKASVLELREAAARGNLVQRSPCRDCRQPFSPNGPEISDEELERHARIMGGSWRV